MPSTARMHSSNSLDRLATERAREVVVAHLADAVQRSRRSRTRTVTPAPASRGSRAATRRRAAAGGRRRRTRRRRRTSSVGGRCGRCRSAGVRRLAGDADPVAAERASPAARSGTRRRRRAAAEEEGAREVAHHSASGTKRVEVSVGPLASAARRSTRSVQRSIFGVGLAAEAALVVHGDDGRLVDALEAGLEHAQAVVDVLEAHPVALVVEADGVERLVADELERGGHRAARGHRAPRAGRRGRTGSGGSSRGCSSEKKIAGVLDEAVRDTAAGRRRRRPGGPACRCARASRSSQPASGNSMSALTSTASARRRAQLEADVDGREKPSFSSLATSRSRARRRRRSSWATSSAPGCRRRRRARRRRARWSSSETRQRRSRSSSSGVRRYAGTMQSVGRMVLTPVIGSARAA